MLAKVAWLAELGWPCLYITTTSLLHHYLHHNLHHYLHHNPIELRRGYDFVLKNKSNYYIPIRVSFAEGHFCLGKWSSDVGSEVGSDVGSDVVVM